MIVLAYVVALAASFGITLLSGVLFIPVHMAANTIMMSVIGRLASVVQISERVAFAVTTSTSSIMGFALGVCVPVIQAITINFVLGLFGVKPSLYLVAYFVISAVISWGRIIGRPGSQAGAMGNTVGLVLMYRIFERAGQ